MCYEILSQGCPVALCLHCVYEIIKNLLHARSEENEVLTLI